MLLTESQKCGEARWWWHGRKDFNFILTSPKPSRASSNADEQRFAGFGFSLLNLFCLQFFSAFYPIKSSCSLIGYILAQQSKSKCGPTRRSALRRSLKAVAVSIGYYVTISNPSPKRLRTLLQAWHLRLLYAHRILERLQLLYQGFKESTSGNSCMFDLFLNNLRWGSSAACRALPKWHGTATSLWIKKVYINLIAAVTATDLSSNWSSRALHHSQQQFQDSRSKLWEQ